MISRWMTSSFHKMKDLSLAKGEKPVRVPDEPDASPMNLDDLVSAFLLIGAINLLSVATFIAEKAVFHLTDWMKRKRTTAYME
jgi:hypothetical protein